MNRFFLYILARGGFGPAASRAFVLVLAVALVSVGGWGGYYYSRHLVDNAVTVQVQQTGEAEERLQKVKREMVEVRDKVLQQNFAMLAQLGDMQVDVHRLQITLAKIIDQAGIGEGELLITESDGAGGLAPPLEADDLARMPDLSGKVLASFDEITEQLESMKLQSNVLARFILRHRIQSISVPYGLPVQRLLVNSGFGPRKDPVNGQPSFHYGIDLASNSGGRVYATAPGIVNRAGPNGRFGVLIEINHGDGYQTRYAHLASSMVSSGEIVNRGQHIGVAGNTGHSTGVHLHYEVLVDGKAVDPYPYVAGQLRTRLGSLEHNPRRRIDR